MLRELNVKDKKPKRYRRPTGSVVSSIEPWTKWKRRIDKGLKPGEHFIQAFAPGELAGYGIRNRRTVHRFIGKYLQEKEWDYVVEFKAFTRGEDGWDCFYISRPE